MQTKSRRLTTMNCLKKLALGMAGVCLVLAVGVMTLQAQGQQPKQPQAKTKAEYDAYTAVYNEQDPNKKVELGNKFLTDYPDSEFKAFVYQILINSYAGLNNAAKVAETGEKFMTDFPQADLGAKKFVLQRMIQSYQAMNKFEETVQTGEKLLAVDPNDLAALLTLCSVLPERLPQDEAKKTEQLQKSLEYSQKAEKAINDLFNGPKPAQITDQQWADEKNRSLASVYASMGLVSLSRKEFEKAVEHYEKATALAWNNPIDFYRLGLAYAFEARALGKELNDMYNAQSQAPDAATKIDEKKKQFTTVRDKAIDALAKSVALKGVTEPQARAELEKLWKSKNDNLNGLDAHIQQMLEALKKGPPQ
jgi:tetratricopeptide (TPR) repeat protein